MDVLSKPCLDGTKGASPTTSQHTITKDPILCCCCARLSLDALPLFQNDQRTIRVRTHRYLGDVVDDCLPSRTAIAETMVGGRRVLSVLRKMCAHARRGSQVSQLLFYRGMLVWWYFYALSLLFLSHSRWRKLATLHPAAIRISLVLPSYAARVATLLKKSPLLVQSVATALRYIKRLQQTQSAKHHHLRFAQ